MSNSSPTRICVDSSVVVMTAIEEQGSLTARSQWQELTDAGVVFTARGLLRFEITSVCRKRQKRGDLSREDAIEALLFLLSLPIEYGSYPDVHLHALEIAGELDQTVAYDAHYLALARYLNCPFWTADKTLYSDAIAVGIDARLLGPD